MLRLEDYSELPPFANERNRKLDAEIKAKEARLALLEAQLEDNSSRTGSMLEHMKNVQQELVHIQNLQDARNREIETEEHFKTLAEREIGRYVSEMKLLEKETIEISDKASGVQNSIYRTNEKVSKLRGLLASEQKELDEWLKVQTEKEEDNLVILKYSKEDDVRIKELSVQIEKLMTEVNKKKNQLNQEMAETQVSQIELERTTEAFKKIHEERQMLLQQWEAAINTMKERDESIMKAQEQYQKLKEEIREKQAIIDEKQRFLYDETRNNSEVEKKIQLLDRQASKLKAEIDKATQSFIAYQDEVEVIKNKLTQLSGDVLDQKSDVKNLKANLEEKRERLEKEKLRATAVQERLASVMDGTMSKEQKAMQLQSILRQDEAKNKELEKEIKNLKELCFRQNQELFKLRREEKTLQAEISGAQATIRILQSKINKSDQESLKQQTLLYNHEFQIQQLERKVRRAQGDRTDDEKEVLLKKIEELNNAMELQNRNYFLLNAQLRRSQDDLRQAKRRLEALEKEKKVVTEQIDEVNLHNDSTATQLIAKVKEKEEIMVEENILRLELKKLRSFLNVRADQVYSLESRQVELQIALEERTHEIEIHKDIVRAQIKAADEERRSAVQELRDRMNKVDKMKRRYEILMAQFASPDDEDGHEKTQAYYIIKASQEREALQRQGDDLDAKIQKAETEIKALENTLKMMNDRNEGYRVSLQRAEMTPDELEQKEMLEQQLNHAIDKYKQKRREIQELQQDLMIAERQLESLAAEESMKMQIANQLEAKITALNKELSVQVAKKERAWSQVTKMAREIKKSRGIPLDQPLPEELDMRIKEIRELTNMIFAKFGEIAERHPEIEPKIQELYQEAGIRPPSRPSTRLGNHRHSKDSDSMSVVSDRSFRSNSSSRSSPALRPELPSRPVSTSPINIGNSGVKTPTMVSLSEQQANSKAPTKSPTRSVFASRSRSITPSRFPSSFSRTHSSLGEPLTVIPFSRQGTPTKGATTSGGNYIASSSGPSAKVRPSTPKNIKNDAQVKKNLSRPGSASRGGSDDRRVEEVKVDIEGTH